MKKAKELAKIAEQARTSDDGPIAQEAFKLIDLWMEQCEKEAAKGNNHWEKNLSGVHYSSQAVLHRALEELRKGGYEAIVTNRESAGDPSNPWSGGLERWLVIRFQ